MSHPRIWGPLPSHPFPLPPGTWRPRRSIVFASWGAEEFGLIGSTEFTEVSEPPGQASQGIPGRAGLTSHTHTPLPLQEFFSKLQERAVAYINVDISVFGMGEPGLAEGGMEGLGQERALLRSSRSQRHPEGAGHAPGPERHLRRRQTGEGGGGQEAGLQGWAGLEGGARGGA